MKTTDLIRKIAIGVICLASVAVMILVIWITLVNR
jgi:hypothetical protein